jgi:hypothetical protein
VARSSFGNITKRTAGGAVRWRSRWQDATGRQHSATFDTKAEAAAWLAEQSTDRSRGTWTDPRGGRVPLADWVEQWRATGLIDLRPTSRDRVEFSLDVYLLPWLGDVMLGDLDVLTIQDWIARLNRRGLAPETVAKAYRALSKVLNGAVDARLIPSAPKGVKLPKIERNEMRFLTPSEVDRLADAIDSRYRGVVLIGAYGGLRAGEIFALTAKRIDLVTHGVASGCRHWNGRGSNRASGSTTFATPRRPGGSRTARMRSRFADGCTYKRERRPRPLRSPVPRQRGWGDGPAG